MSHDALFRVTVGVFLSLISSSLYAKSNSIDRMQLGNPASRLCAKLDGHLEIYGGTDGERGICWLGQAGVEEWTLYQYLRGSHKKLLVIESLKKRGDQNLSRDKDSARKFCTNQGGELESFQSRERPDTHILICEFKDGSSVESWTLFHGMNHFPLLKKALSKD